MNSKGVTIQMKATEQCFPVVLYIMLYKVVQTFEFVHEIFSEWQLKWKLQSSAFTAVLLFYKLNTILTLTLTCQI